jgi:hypothetical protein
MWLVLVACALGSISAGYFAWHLETRRLYKRGDEVFPTGMGAGERERWVLAKRKRRRLIRTAFYAMGGAVAGFGALMALALRR